MTIRKLNTGRRAPASGKVSNAVVFLHGYGADGNDLLGLADPLAPHMPDTLFLAPNAPDVCRGNPAGFQWFPIPWIDGSSEDAARAGLARAAMDLDAWLDGVLAEEGLQPAQVALLGFSQGTMMALHVAPRRPVQLAAVVGFSGRLLGEKKLAEEARTKPPVLLLHGDQDDVVPVMSLPDAAGVLEEAGFEVYAQIMQGQGHGISPQGLATALGFLNDKLPRGVVH